MYIAFIFSNIFIIIAIFIIFIISYKKAVKRLKSKQILLKEKIRQPFIFPLIYVLLLSCLTACIISNYIIGSVFSSILIVLNAALHFKLIPHYFCIYKDGIALLNGFKEIYACYRWPFVKVFSFDSKNKSKAYICVINEDGNSSIVKLKLSKDNLDLFKLLMEKALIRHQM